MPTSVLLTGAHGRVGSAIRSHLADRETYEFTYLDVEDHPDHETFLGDITEYDDIRPAFEGQDAVVHLAGEPSPGADWDRLHELNVNGTYNVLQACEAAGVPTVVFASTNHVLGGYPDFHGDEIGVARGRTIGNTDPPRPDSYYAVTKLYGENLGRYYVDYETAPGQFYAARIGYVLEEEYDSPYGPAEQGVDAGHYERGSESYRQRAEVGHRLWCSRRDMARFTDCALADGSVTFGAFGVRSGGEKQWLDIEHAREVIGYEPADDTADYDPPG
jgi:nucleoside-diphosphate-sugar epimerase